MRCVRGGRFGSFRETKNAGLLKRKNGYFGGGVFPCISLTYSLCRWGFFHFRSLKCLVICWVLCLDASMWKRGDVRFKTRWAGEATRKHDKARFSMLRWGDSFFGGEEWNIITWNLADSVAASVCGTQGCVKKIGGLREIWKPTTMDSFASQMVYLDH